MKLRCTVLLLLLAHVTTFAQPPAKKKHDGNNKSTLNTKEVSEQPANNSKKEADDKSENVTGIWRGYFVQNALGIFEDKYRFEVQVAEQDNHSLQAVTYSYKTTVFYGKADATGIYTAKSRNFLLKEIKLTDVKLTDRNSTACLMTCYLDYEKIGKHETLSGTYTSVSIRDKSDCGSGRVYLEKKPDSDFYKEEFVSKRENELKAKEKSKKKLAKILPKDKPAPIDKPILKPGAENNVIKPGTTKNPSENIVINPKKDSVKATAPNVIKTFPKPEVLKTRVNDLQKTIETTEKDFKIELYDNGEIDGDRISVYHNNRLIVSDKELSNKPITFTIHADENEPIHDFVMVAENLGTIPPNTALMIITAGSQRYELFVTSTNQKNALVRVEYKSPD